jgi:hypothetical protein
VITAPDTQEALREQLLRDAEAISARAREVAAALTPEQLLWTPPDKGWSVAQIFEHLCIAHDSYLDRLQQTLEGEELPRRAGTATPWAPRFAGAFLVRSLRASRKLPSPRLYRVGPRPRPRAIDEFLERQDRFITLIDRAAPLEWSACQLSSPTTSIIRFNLGDAFLIMVAHAQRHLGQVARVRTQLAASQV